MCRFQNVKLFREKFRFQNAELFREKFCFQNGELFREKLCFQNVKLFRMNPGFITEKGKRKGKQMIKAVRRPVHLGKE